MRILPFMVPPSKFVLPAAVASLAFGASRAQAVVVAFYDFEPATSLASDDTELTSTAGDISSGSGLGANTSTTGDTVNQGGPTAGTNSRRYANATATTEADAVTGNDYISITVTPSANPNEALDFVSLSFGAELNVSTAAELFFVRSSVDSYAANLGSGTITTISMTDTAFQVFTINLSSLPTTNSAVTFRIYLYDGASGVDTRFDNFTVNANVVPEPSAAMLLLAASGSFCLRRSRRSA